jgi:hypothetical protein
LSRRTGPGLSARMTAIAMLHGGSADALLKSPQYDIARAARLVRLMEQGMETLVTTFPPVLRPMPQQVPGPVDPATGAPTMQTQTVMQEVPGWMPRKQDNIAIYKQVIGDAMKTPRYDEYPPDIKEIFNLVWSGLEFSEQEQAMERASMEQQMAQGLGMANAAKPQGQIAQPSKPAIGNGAPSSAT